MWAVDKQWKNGTINWNFHLHTGFMDKNFILPELQNNHWCSSHLSTRPYVEKWQRNKKSNATHISTNNAKILSLTKIPHHTIAQLRKGLAALYKAVLQISQKWLPTATICQYVTCITC
jgi:hypothetical protein